MYLFTSKRLGFRNWNSKDLGAMTLINANEDVMKHFPKTLSSAETEAFIKRMQRLYLEKKYCYFATETLNEKELIGFIGLNLQTFQSDFTPCIDLGWRLHPEHWGKGYATEGAIRCMAYAEDLGIDELYAMAPERNLNSIKVMERIGMKRERNFLHPLTPDGHPLERCLLYKYRINRSGKDQAR